MKWYSVKTHRPPSCNSVFIRATNGEWDRHFVGFIEDFNLISNLETWELHGHYDIDLSSYKVTHFTIIDPVEIEE